MWMCFLLFGSGFLQIASGDRINLKKNELIGDFFVHSSKTYRWFFLEKYKTVYTDRKYVYTSVPDTLRGCLALKTANGDKYRKMTDLLISFTVKKAAIIYVIYTDIYTYLENDWLSDKEGWDLKSFSVRTNLSSRKAMRLVRGKFFPSGSKVKLFGNGCISRNCDMYSVVVVPQNKP
jgi:hypothetical protein